MAGNLGRRRRPPIAEINVVPLVDIILVVLIIFMVTAPLVLKPSIDVNLPKAASGEDSPPTPLTIALGREGESRSTESRRASSRSPRSPRNWRKRNRTSPRSLKPTSRSPLSA